ncbi:hypothetical protein FSZ31_04440 [Sphingorhabdus soli]|uniref:Uncharacterized protein n=1 Tax=Flavisphingopyxis soli TaxID=2601267 RepID=A0A5C6UPC2_9SPHN|nr:hypothetical protein [Sphingorhabdus soli]TXC73976.1 hypothetical protein FSZ31_04440 [Sphingorhabdus soli]
MTRLWDGILPPWAQVVSVIGAVLVFVAAMYRTLRDTDTKRHEVDVDAETKRIEIATKFYVDTFDRQRTALTLAHSDIERMRQELAEAQVLIDAHSRSCRECKRQLAKTSNDLTRTSSALDGLDRDLTDVRTKFLALIEAARVGGDAWAAALEGAKQYSKGWTI